jgi:uncharacterized protein
MKRLSLVPLSLLGALVLVCAAYSGCQKPAPPPVAVAPEPPPLPTAAQPKLPTMRLWVGTVEMVAELAVTPVQEQTGMMFRTNMEENAGMLFPLPYTQRASFWMANCPLPLSAAYISPDGIIQEIHDLHSYDTNSVVAHTDNIRFVLETPQGWFQRHKIQEGTAVSTERGSLMDTFFKP